MSDRYLRLPSRHLDKKVHLWTHGNFGQPVLVFPSAAGMAHEWQLGGAIDALRPLMDAGLIKLYCVESNVSSSWLADGVHPQTILERHGRYERFIVEELVPWIWQDCRSSDMPLVACGVSFGGFYALNFTLKNPEIFRRALCLSGRYDVGAFLEGDASEAAWFNQPMAYVPQLRGEALRRAAMARSTLVVGQGAHEGRCISETARMARALKERGLPCDLDVWGHDVSHDWVWWRRQLRFHLGRIVGA